MPAAPGIHADTMPGLIPNEDNDSCGPRLAFIDNINDESIANVFCFSAFADKNTGVVCNDCTGNFPFLSLDGNVCFFVMYHHGTNAIFAMPIPGLDSNSILVAYKKNFEYLVSKGYKPKINIMDNQATKAINSYLTPQECKLQLVKPGNHCVNAAKRAIQTLKNRFIGALGTTNVNFPIHLWDKMAPQVQDAINLVCRLRISPNKSAYEALEGPYDWNRYPLGHLQGCGMVRIVGPTRPRCVASWTLQRSLSAQLILGTRNQRVLRLRLSRPLPTTLHCPRFHICYTHARAVDGTARYPGHHGLQTTYRGHPPHTFTKP